MSQRILMSDLNFRQSPSTRGQNKMFNFFLLSALICATQSFVINCTCGPSSYHAMLKEVVYSCVIGNLSFSTDMTDNILANVIRKHELKKTNADVKLLKVHNQTLHELPERLGLFFLQIEGLEVINSGLIIINKEHLKDMKNLKYLNLMKNKIEVLRNDVFYHNPKIQFLIICCNKLKVIGTNIFENFYNVKHVDFRRNICLSTKSDDSTDLAKMKIEIRKKCPPAIEVYCTFADTNFSAGKFYTCEVRFWIIIIDYMAVEDFQGRHDSARKNHNVRGLRVHDMTTKYLPINLCKHFPRLEAIEVVGGKMVKLERNDIKIYPHLKVLWLPRNNIETLSSDVFQENLQLEKISFYENRLKFIDSDILKSLQHLKYINLELNDCIDSFANTAICIKSIEKKIVEQCQKHLNA